ncbi:conserved hypothetical protein [Ricinus communis]|uniref:Uncharacterized protein n=1 Tax=Ricinus communis TaxID=3988 RepID=B9TGC4_RICCO|nr:conserved hypothetical protein [Ricinus communis]
MCTGMPASSRVSAIATPTTPVPTMTTSALVEIGMFRSFRKPASATAARWAWPSGEYLGVLLRRGATGVPGKDDPQRELAHRPLGQVVKEIFDLGGLPRLGGAEDGGRQFGMLSKSGSGGGRHARADAGVQPVVDQQRGHLHEARHVGRRRQSPGRHAAPGHPSGRHSGRAQQ